MKKSLVINAFLLAVLAVLGFSPFVGAARASIYYVSPSGNDSGSGSSGSPFATIQHAADIVSPGDTVIVEDGTYTSSANQVVDLTKGGSASGGYVTFESQNPWGAVLDGQGESTYWGFLFESGVSYVKVQGFTVQNFEFEGILATNGNNNDLIFYGNNVNSIANVDTGANGGAGIDINNGGSYITIDSNVVWNCGGGALYNHDHGIDFEYGNYDHVWIINNICYENTHGWDVQLYPSSSQATDFYIVGNTFASNNSTTQGNVIPDFSFSNGLIADNIFYNPGNGQAMYSAGSGLTVEYNLTTGSSMGISGSNNILNASASSIFVSPSSNNYQLAAGSPVIQAGITSPYRTYAYLGQTLNSPPDIGAYQYGTAAPSSTGSTGTSGTGSSGTAGTTNLGSASISNSTGSPTVTIDTTTGGITNTASTGTPSTSSTSPASTTLVAPDPVAPSNGSTTNTTVTFTWKRHNQNGLKYKIMLSKNSQFADGVTINVASASNVNNNYAGAAGVFLFGIALAGGLRRRKKLLMLLAGGLLCAVVLVSCGGGGGESSSPSGSSGTVSPAATDMASYTVSGLSNNTTYYWKVVALDSSGNQVEGSVSSFTTN